jgi:hypothetical protein
MKSILSRKFRLGLALVMSSSVSVAAERFNHDGRLLPPQSNVYHAVLFNTPEADAILASMQILPVDNPWNEDISRRPLLPNSDAMIARIMSDLSSSRRTMRAFQEMNFVLVPDTQPLVPIQFVDYPDESDPGPWPIPSNMPVETWPSQTGDLTLEQWQQDIYDTGGDRHSIIVQPGAATCWETWQAKLVGTQWQASNGARFDLNRNALRPQAGPRAMLQACPCFQPLSVTTKRSAVWSSTAAALLWRARVASTSTLPGITLPLFRPLRPTCPPWANDCA